VSRFVKPVLIALVVVAMVALHQDAWLWRDARLLFGFLPVGLAYHAGYSLLSSLVMLALVRFAWPRDLDGEPRP
jgi:hypothetical protein